MLEATLRLYTGGIERIEAKNPRITGTDLREKCKKVVDEVIESTGSWVSSTEKHEDKDVTLNTPLKGNNSMQTSFAYDFVNMCRMVEYHSVYETNLYVFMSKK